MKFYSVRIINLERRSQTGLNLKYIIEYKGVADAEVRGMDNADNLELVKASNLKELASVSALVYV